MMLTSQQYVEDIVFLILCVKMREKKKIDLVDNVMEITIIFGCNQILVVK